ncbi:hypothetical protein C8Q77DRAFT_1070868 [Trametes polyzona]|nr:hypothetical protein C8Q77DRAFT_1070868 [Trametes polyzona]
MDVTVITPENQPEACEMLLRALTSPDEEPSQCTRWWVQELLAAPSRPICGGEPEVIPDYLAHITPEQQREIDACERSTAWLQEAAARLRASADDSKNDDGSPDAESKTKEEKEEKAAARAAAEAQLSEAWTEGVYQLLDVWSEVLFSSPEERAWKSEPMMGNYWELWGWEPPAPAAADTQSSESDWIFA